MSSSREIKAAYRYCLDMAKSHYENFPVASWLMPRRIRLPIAAIYAFARTADDFADEGDLSVDQRYAELDAMSEKLHTLERGESINEPIFIALADAIERFALPYSLLHDLLSAFRQDVEKRRYTDFGEVMDYCRRSANPVGRLLLHLFGAATPRNLALSDGVCSALQLINFMQDIGQDFDENDRIYLPQDEMKRFGVGEKYLQEKRKALRMDDLITLQLDRAEKMLRAGCPLGIVLKGRFGFELRMICEGGVTVLYKLRERTNPFERPRLERRDWYGIVRRALLPKRVRR
ncbi:squalene synthase HpnC [Solemya pervernicosa gill symbiont]|uniref:Squalene synthase HpnC n=2 Tax=Gammaproteobacteria incertae sedis TaxID=118884 RepID=A0A1T2L6C9_9GAMM|nr:squalene synthase HpnC [Candidatus Reidiella endopervernicosa]OOZ40612.1 squalene synthase HpnC [Solemya pervernicosa gill symbiont]QKQ26633.1 squalene synthase HpnC [Candidatus Reidiella endopervernicosa]